MPQQPNDNLDKLASTIYQPLQQQTQPTFEPQNRPVSGWGGKGVGLANIAVQFLGGVAKGRALAYDRSLQDQHKQVAAIQSAIETVDQSGATEEVKTAERTRLQILLARMIQGSLPDEGKGKGKGKKSQVYDEMGRASDGPTQQGAHPILAGVKGMLDSMLGPAPKKNDINKETIQASIGQALSAVSNKENWQETQAQNAETALSAAWKEAIDANGGKPLSSTQVAANQKLASVIAQYNRVNGEKPGPMLKTIAQAVHTADQQNDPKYQSELKHFEAMTRALDNKGVKLYQNSDGETISRNEESGKFFDAGGNQIPGNDPRLKDLSIISSKKAASHLLTKQGDDGYVYKFDPVDGHDLGRLMVKDSKGNDVPFKATSPLGRMFLQQGFVDEKDMRDRSVNINEHFSKLMEDATNHKGWTPKQIKDAQDEIQKQWDQNIGINERSISRKGSSKPPPSRSGVEKTKSPQDMSTSDILNSFKRFFPNPATDSQAAQWANK